MSLRSKVIRLAHENTGLRGDLLNMLTARYTPPGMGTGDETEKLRWHVFASAVRVYDLTFAGKRGKRVSILALYDIDMVQDDMVQKAIGVWIKGLKKNDFGQALKGAQDLVKLSQESESLGTVKMQLREEKGVRVAPGGFKPFKANWEFVEVEATYDSFTIRDKVDKNNLPACIPAMNGRKADVKAFYRFVKDNEKRLKSMQFYEILGELGDEGIRYHSYCRMD